jgi:upstream activation factor subunit UAF30
MYRLWTFILCDFYLRSEIVKRLWAYLKEKNLQDPENKQWFTPDKLMEPVFGSERIKAFGMSKFLGAHLSN